MGDDLARKLYETLIANTPDVGMTPPTWERLHRKDRETWESVALVARTHMREQFALAIERHARESSCDEIAFEKLSKEWGSR